MEETAFSYGTREITLQTGCTIQFTRIQSIWQIGKHLCPNTLLPFLENIDRRNCVGGRLELTSVFHYSHRKDRSSTSAVDLTFEYLVGVSSKAAPNGLEKYRF